MAITPKGEPTPKEIEAMKAKLKAKHIAKRRSENPQVTSAYDKQVTGRSYRRAGKVGAR